MRIGNIRKCILFALLIGAFPLAAHPAPSVSSVAAPATVGLYDKFEVTFNVDTVATNLYWPYDPSPAANTSEHPNAVPAGVGVSVDGLFLPPGEASWDNAIVQPGFYFQDYEMGPYMQWSHNIEWLYPKDNPCWKIRLAPKLLGEWRYRIRVTDSGGSVTYSPTPGVFQCDSSASHGFVRVSPDDWRYFETSDGTWLNLHGLEHPPVQHTQDQGGLFEAMAGPYDWDAQYPTLVSNGINAVRVWWNCTGPWERCALSGISDQHGGLAYWSNLQIDDQVTRPGRLYSGKLASDVEVTFGVSAKPNTRYRFSAWVKTVGLTAPEGSGVFLKIYRSSEGNFRTISSVVSGDTDWTEISGFFTNPSRVYDAKLYIVRSGATAGMAYFTDMSVREDLGGGNYGPELMWRTNFDHWTAVPQGEAWRADYQTECARRNGMYLKVVLMDKGESGYRWLQPDGTADKSAGTSDNVYANATHAARTYQQYFWRYIIARYGYSTNIHSFEFTNEGDPFNGHHWEATQAMARFFKDNDANRHLVTTSNWHSFPSGSWTGSSFPDIGYADWHSYVGELSSDPLVVKRFHGWENSARGQTGRRYQFATSTSVYRSTPASLYLTNTTDPDDDPAVYQDYCSASKGIPITPGHHYTLKWWVKAQGLATANPTNGVCMRVHIGRDWSVEANGVFNVFETGKITTTGSYDWTQSQYEFDSPSDGWYLQLKPTMTLAKGHVYFDDITLLDNTTGEQVTVPNGDFSSDRVDYDTALMVYGYGQEVGDGTRRQVKMPVINPNCGIVRGDSSNYEWEDVSRDTEGVWFRKLVWSQANPYGVYAWYYWGKNIIQLELYKYTKAYQAFMSDVSLSRGGYVDAAAAASNTLIRAWGQKNLASGRAHLWIDNSKNTWRNAVDGVVVPPVSGTITLSGFSDGAYRVEWWDTSTGLVTRTDDVQCSGGNITLSVVNLTSDTACKVYPGPANIGLRILVPSADVVPGEIVTVTVEYINNGQTEARGVMVSARVPAEMDYVAGSAESSGGTYSSGTGNVSWTVESVGAGQSGTRTFQATVR